MITDIQKGLIEEVRFRMAAQNVSQLELALRVGMSQKHISQMLCGRVEGSLSAWQRLMDGLEKTPWTK